MRKGAAGSFYGDYSPIYLGSEPYAVMEWNEKEQLEASMVITHLYTEGPSRTLSWSGMHRLPANAGLCTERRDLWPRRLPHHPLFNFLRPPAEQLQYSRLMFTIRLQ